MRSLNSSDNTATSRGESAHPVTPQRFVSGISVDALDPNHAIVSYSGYSAYTPTTPGHVFDVHFDPATGTATWRDISHNLGDQPVTNVAYDTVTGDVYAGTEVRKGREHIVDVRGADGDRLGHVRRREVGDVRGGVAGGRDVQAAGARPGENRTVWGWKQP